MKLRNGYLQHGDKVEIYRNLHNDTFSVRLLGAADKWDTKRWREVGKVVKHLENWMTLYLQDARFAVQPAGREKVRREGKKNVHAFVRGTIVKASKMNVKETFKELCTQEAVYNPYKFDTFVTQAWSSNPCAIKIADLVTFNQGKVYVSL
jgi:hypothetical protein